MAKATTHPTCTPTNLNIRTRSSTLYANAPILLASILLNFRRRPESHLQLQVSEKLPAHLPRIEKIIACTPEQCVCGNCGKENSVIGYEKSEQLDVKPAEYFVVVTKREKRACKDCEEQGVECAPAPVRIIEKGLASDRVVIDTVVSKYAD